MDDQEISSTADASPPKPIFSFAFLKAATEERAQAGWIWDDATLTLTDPADREFFFRIDSITRQLSPSAKLARQLSVEQGTEQRQE